MKMVEHILKLIGLWYALSVATLAATVSPSVSPDENTKLAPASSSLGPVYREARDYNAHEPSGYNYHSYDRPPQSRCISCLYAAMTGNQDRDRYYDPFYSNYYYRPTYPSHGYGMPAYGPQRENEDRNWYYQPDDRNRPSSPYENRYPNQKRYDNRPASGSYAGYSRPGGNAGYPISGGYDRNDNRQNYQDYRGNGYDNRDPMYYSAMKGGSNRGYGDRDSSYESYYDDRMSNRGYSHNGVYGDSNYYMRPSYQNSGYDQDRYYGHGRPHGSYERPDRPEYYDKNVGYAGYGGSNTAGYSDFGGYRGTSSTYDDFRPWDQTYRGVSGFDSQGHGHYFANSNSQYNPSQPPLPQNPNQQAPPRPLQQHGSHHTSSGPSHHSQNSQHSYESDSLVGHGSSGSSSSSSSSSHNGKGSFGGNWNYINSNDRNNAHHGHQGYGQSQDKDAQSSSYGERPGHGQLNTSYLHERETPSVISGDNPNTNINRMKQTTTKNNDDNEKNQSNGTDKIVSLKNQSDDMNAVLSTSTDISNQ